MFLNRTIGWWYWLTTVGLLIAGFAGWPLAIPLAMALTAVQIVHYTITEGHVGAFWVQVRIAYLMMLIIGLWEPFRILHAIQLVGTTAVVVFNYCLTARVLVLMPWNRKAPLSVGLVIRTIFSRPVPADCLERMQKGQPCPEIVRA